MSCNYRLRGFVIIFGRQQGKNVQGDEEKTKVDFIGNFWLGFENASSESEPINKKVLTLQIQVINAEEIEKI